MRIPFKLPRFLTASILALSLLAGTGLLPTQQAVAAQYDRLVITDRWGSKIVDENDLVESYKEILELFDHVPDSQEGYIKRVIERSADEMANTYPKYEIIAINGVPWQETEWADLIKSAFMAENKETGWVAYPQPLRELIFDPRLNGKGYEIDRLVKEGKTPDEVRAQLIKDTAVVTTKPVEKVKEPSTELKTDNPEDYQIVLTVGMKDGTEIKNGVNRPIAFDTPPEIIENTTMVPLRGVVDRFGAEIAWDNTSSTAIIKMGNNIVTVQVNTTIATINGNEKTLTVPPINKNGRVLIPLRFISEGLGLEVNWDDLTRSIILKQPHNSSN